MSRRQDADALLKQAIEAYPNVVRMLVARGCFALSSTTLESPLLQDAGTYVSLHVSLGCSNGGA